MAKKGPAKNTWERDALQAVIIADSFNVRFAPLSLDRPRALIPLCNEALLDHTLHFLATAHVDEVIVFCCSFSQQIQDHLTNSGLDVKTCTCGR
jgi:translation initiation factor eIF-2B subunit epsilon